MNSEGYYYLFNVADLTFTEKKSGRVHIDIRFEKREHGDGDPFDGQALRCLYDVCIKLERG